MCINRVKNALLSANPRFHWTNLFYREKPRGNSDRKHPVGDYIYNNNHLIYYVYKKLSTSELKKGCFIWRGPRLTTPHWQWLHVWLLSFSLSLSTLFFPPPKTLVATESHRPSFRHRWHQNDLPEWCGDVAY
jgi:hypothetical protein